MACTFCRGELTTFASNRFFAVTDVITRFVRAKAQVRWPQRLRELQQARNPLHLCARVRRGRSHLCPEANLAVADPHSANPI